MFDSYELGTRCWVSSKTAGWEDATVDAKCVKSATECELDLVLGSSGTRTTVFIKSDPAPEVPLRNPPALESTSDLVTLSYLNEPSVLHAIQQRYSQLNIYTFSGIVLIATNPFDRMDNLYTNEVVQMYSGRQRGELEPHLFSIAEDAFRCMQRDNKNQTIVVSGESGAGKTMSAKYIMRYFATVEDPQKAQQKQFMANSAETSSDGLSKVEREILATNPIMEAFGNAKTTRNDNSSRFGKYLEIRFDLGLNINGARIRTHLLERSRIVFHQDTERNYHIFYQLLRGLQSEQLAKLGLDGGLEQFHYVNQGDPTIVGVDDADDFKVTCQALEIVGVDATQQWAVFEMLAGLLHLGNIELKATSRSVLVSSEDPALIKCAELLGLSPANLAKWLMKKQIQMRSEVIVSDLDLNTALVVRDSIAKYLYSALFDWLVAAVNSKLYSGETNDDRFIGVLDIYGFEHFKHNSFEQFCINYANEKLQQEFNRHVFKLEQQEYSQEDIDWQYIDYVDNQPCIALIEDRGGILGLLDEESRLPAGTDDGLTQKLYNGLEQREHFRKPRLGLSSFIVAHYAHDVEYETEGFLEKNRDTVPDTVISVLNESTNPFLEQLLKQQAEVAQKAEAEAEAKAKMAEKAAERAGPKSLGGGPARRGGANKRPTLGNIFKTSLIELMETISSTNAHYIRCIKPNEQKEAWAFDGPLVLSQLRACGVLETIRISSKGFPGRWLYDEFAFRYGMLLPSKLRNTKDSQVITKSILEHVGEANDDSRKTHALGKTKVFLRAGMLAQLENKRTKCHHAAAVQIQKLVKMRTARKTYLGILVFVTLLQTASRGRYARLLAERELIARATVGVHALCRRYLQRHAAHRAVSAVTGIQQVFRIVQARKNAELNLRHSAATSIQSLFRATQHRNKFLRQRHAFTIVQSMWRSRVAQQRLQKMMADEHSVKHYEEKQYRMENKVVELQNALVAKREDHKATTEKLSETESTLAAIQAQLAALQATHEQMNDKWKTSSCDLQSQADLHRDVAEQLREELESKSKHIEQLRDALDERERAVQNLSLEVSELKQNNQRLEEQVRLTAQGQIGAGPIGAGAAYRQINSQEAARVTSAARAPRVVDPSALSEEQNQISEEIDSILTQPRALQQELITKLIQTIDIPSKTTEKLSDLDVKFPANITNLLISEMWQYGHIAASEQLISAVFTNIQNVVQSLDGEKIITAGPFWITNVHQIFSFFTLAEENIRRNPELQDHIDADALENYVKLTQIAKEDAVNLIYNIYWHYMKEIKAMVDKMVVPAIIEEQAIPGFYTEPQRPTGWSLPLFSKNKDIKMDDLILLLSKIDNALHSFYLEEEYIKSPLLEVLNLMGNKSFNDLIMRRNFLSWRRGVQISYNATRIDEWCKGHGIGLHGVGLDCLMQSSKLVQLNKDWTGEDFSVVYDICWSLNPTQIHKLLNNYVTLDYEQPIVQPVKDYMLKRIKESDASTVLVIPLRPLTDSGPLEFPVARTLERLEPYIPTGIDAPLLRKFIELTTTSSRLNEEAMYYEDQHDLEANGEPAQQVQATAYGDPAADKPMAESTRIEA